jgi:hypothetical protein
MDSQDSSWLGLGEATTFPLIVFFVLGHKANTQMSFCPETPKLKSEILKIEIPTTLEGHNFYADL